MLSIIVISILLNLLLAYLLINYFKSQKTIEKNEPNHQPRSHGDKKNLIEPPAFDVKTGLTSYIHFQDYISKVIHAARLNPIIFAILCFEIDDYSLLTQKYGKQIIDELVAAVSRKLKSLLRTTDVVSEQAQNHFWVMLTYLATPESCMYVALRLKEAVQQVFMIQDKTISITITMGIVLYPQDGNDTRTLLENAEKSLNAAKQLGKNVYHFHTPQLHEMGAREESIISWLRDPVALNSLILYYQPCLDVDKNNVIAIDALLFLDHPDFTLIPFTKFAKPAIHCNKMMEIGEWLIEHVFFQYKKWQSIYNENIPRLILPLSLQQFQNPGFINKIVMMLKEANIPPEKIVLQIVEGLPSQNPILLEKACRQIEEAGLNLALNLLTLGTSTLQHIGKLPIKYLKIDKKIVSAMLAENEQILEMIFAIASPANIFVVAQGVDNKQEEAYLRKLGCIYMQGSLFATPVLANALKLN